jgi:hypothetical protein
MLRQPRNIGRFSGKMSLSKKPGSGSKPWEEDPGRKGINRAISSAGPVASIAYPAHTKCQFAAKRLFCSSAHHDRWRESGFPPIGAYPIWMSKLSHACGANLTPNVHSSLTTLTLTQKTLIVDKEVKRLVTHLIDAWRTRAHAETAKAKEQSH